MHSTSRTETVGLVKSLYGETIAGSFDQPAVSESKSQLIICFQPLSPNSYKNLVKTKELAESDNNHDIITDIKDNSSLPEYTVQDTSNITTQVSIIIK